MTEFMPVGCKYSARPADIAICREIECPGRLRSVARAHFPGRSMGALGTRFDPVALDALLGTCRELRPPLPALPS
jgi:hypothetical protein